MQTNTHCDMRLDKLIGKRVRVEFNDKSWCEGILTMYKYKYGLAGYTLLTVRRGLLRYITYEGIYLFSKSKVRSASLI